MKSYQDQFIEAFSEAFAEGNKGLIEECIAFMYEIMKRVWRERKSKQAAYPIEQLQDNCQRLLSACAESDKDVSKLSFVRLLDRLYEFLFNEVRIAKELYWEAPIIMSSSDSSSNSKHIPTTISNVKDVCVRQYFDILDSWNVYFFFNKILSKIDIRLLRDQCKISDLLYNMQVTDFALSIEREQIRAQIRAQRHAEQKNSPTSQSTPTCNEHEHEQDYVSRTDRASTAGMAGMASIVSRAVGDWKPDSSILYIQQYLGWYLNRQLHNPDITAEEIIDFARDCVLTGDYLYRIDAQHEVRTVLARTFTIENAIYICGLITAGLVDVAKDVFLYCVGDGDNSQDNSNNNRHYITEARYYRYGGENEFILPITVFCYLYYLGFWEEKKYIPAELRNKAKQLTQELSTTYRELFRQQGTLQLLIDELKVDKIKIAGEEKFFPHYIYQIMRRFDFRAQTASSYRIVTKDLVKDFCLFCIVRNYPLSTFDWGGDSEHNILSYLDYVIDEKTTCEKLGQFIEFTNMLEHVVAAPQERTQGNEREKERLTQVLFERLKRGITSQYKDKIKKKAQVAQAQYEKDIAEIKANCDVLEKAIRDITQNQFKNLVTIAGKDETDSSYLKVEILTKHLLTNYVSSSLQEEKESMAPMTTEAYSRLLQEYINLLIREGCLTPKNYDKNDRNYIDFLAENDFDLLLGAQWFFMTSAPEFSEEFNKQIDKYTQIVADGYKKGYRSALINKKDLHFFIRNIKVLISDEKSYDYGNYRAWGDIELPFESYDERRVFVANVAKVITVEAEIRIETGNASGVYFE